MVEYCENNLLNLHQVSLLANVTSTNIFLNIPRHSRPVVNCSNSIVGFSISSTSGFGDHIVNFTHNFHLESCWDYQAMISIPVLKIYQSIFSDLVLIGFVKGIPRVRNFNTVPISGMGIYHTHSAVVSYETHSIIGTCGLLV